MTWILYHQNSFGPFFPNGDFVGKKEKLRTEFDRIASDEMKETYEQSFFEFRDANRISFTRPAGPAAPYQQVDQFCLVRSVKNLADIFKANDGLTVVSGAVKDIIAASASDAVQFWPIEIQGKSASDTPYYAMLALQSRDAFRPDASVDGSCRESFAGANQWHIEGHKKAFLRGLALDAGKIGDGKIWYEQRILTGAMFFSDELATELNSGGFKLPPNFLQCVSV